MPRATFDDRVCTGCSTSSESRAWGRLGAEACGG